MAAQPAPVDSDSRTGAAVPFVPPPLYYVAGLAVGLLVHRAVPLPADGPVVTAIGVLLAVAGAGLVAGGVAGVVRHRTTIVPHHAVSALVVDGAYRWSRNPMYTGLAVAYLGAALLLGSWWPVLLWPAVVAVVDRLVVRREEEYLARRFGEPYAEYTARVRRWL